MPHVGAGLRTRQLYRLWARKTTPIFPVGDSLAEDGGNPCVKSISMRIDASLQVKWEL